MGIWMLRGGHFVFRSRSISFHSLAGAHLVFFPISLRQYPAIEDGPAAVCLLLGFRLTHFIIVFDSTLQDWFEGAALVPVDYAISLEAVVQSDPSV